MPRLAWRNIQRHPRRTLLTAAAIAFAAFLLVFMTALQFGSYDMMINNSLRLLTGHLQIQQAGYHEKARIRNGIPDAVNLAEQLRAAGIPHLRAVAVRAQGFALLSAHGRSYGAQIIGVQRGYEPRLSSLPGQLAAGRFLSGDDALEAFIGAALARNLQVRPGDEITLLGSARDGSVAAAVLSVVGIFKGGTPEIDRAVVEIPLHGFQDIFAMEGQAHGIAVLLDKLEHIPASAAALRAELVKQGHADAVVLDWDTLLPGLRHLIEADMLNGWFMYACLILIVTFSILNTFVMSMLERTREFSMLLALGVPPLHLEVLLVLESLLLTLLGLAVGIAAGAALVQYYTVQGFSYPGMEELGPRFGISGAIFPQLSLFSLLAGPAAVLFCTLLGAVFPALRIRRLDPANVLRTAQ